MRVGPRGWSFLVLVCALSALTVTLCTSILLGAQGSVCVGGASGAMSLVVCSPVYAEEIRLTLIVGGSATIGLLLWSVGLFYMGRGATTRAADGAAGLDA